MTGHNMPFFESTLTRAAHEHLKLPGAFVGFIMGRDVFAQAVALDEGNARAFRIRTPNGAALVLDRHAVLGLDFGFLEGFSAPVEETEKTPEEIAAEESMVAWMEALDTLRTAAAGTKDKAVLAALAVLVEVEKAAEERNASGDAAAAGEGEANGGA